ncbi:expansin family [Fusarium pseudocircinatum]|uniref:Expansin family n=1 Tax=Fusarium pseudocircinatum TaxID=56676 RepID=A0A8H5KK18_9HYPO|nr:expansin family [Fusarium pseudocircinatum]
MYLSKVSPALLSLVIGIQDVAAGPCNPESSQILVESSLGATSSVFDPASTATSIVSSTETTQTLLDNEISSTVSLESSSAEGASATTTSTESILTTTEFSEISTTLQSTSETTEASQSTTEFSSTTEATTEETTTFGTSIGTSDLHTVVPSTTEETPITSTAPVNEQPQIFTGGSATWVFQNGIMGDCGSVSHDTDFVVALDYRRYDRSKCGQKIRVTATSGRHIGLSIDVTIVDACYACVNENSMDLSTGVFSVFGTLDDARDRWISVEMAFLNRFYTFIAGMTIRDFNFGKAEYTHRSSSYDLGPLREQDITKGRQITATPCSVQTGAWDAVATSGGTLVLKETRLRRLHVAESKMKPIRTEIKKRKITLPKLRKRDVLILLRVCFAGMGVGFADDAAASYLTNTTAIKAGLLLGFSASHALSVKLGDCMSGVTHGAV